MLQTAAIRSLDDDPHIVDSYDADGGADVARNQIELHRRGQRWHDRRRPSRRERCGLQSPVPSRRFARQLRLGAGNEPTFAIGEPERQSAGGKRVSPRGLGTVEPISQPSIDGSSEVGFWHLSLG